MTPEEEERYRWQEEYFEMYRQLREQISSRRKRRWGYQDKQMNKPRNFVQKWMRFFCKNKVEKDRKKDSKRGYQKHKKLNNDDTQ